MRPGGLLFHLSYHKMPDFDSPEGRSGAIFSTGRRPAAEETDKMQTQQLQQNMKEKVKVFEDGGIRLLKKGQKGLVHAIFSRFGLVLVLLLLQFGALFSLLRWFGQLLPHYLGGTALVTAAMVVYLLNIDMDNSVRITWLVVIAVLPVLGVPLFWYTKADIGHNALKKRLMDLESQTRAQLPQPEGVEQRLEADSPGAASLARYLRGRGGGFPVYGNTAVTYFNGGEAKFAELLRQLETAEHYIFLEYFIIDEGLMWGRILEVLARKAAGGVDVRVMYDGTCEFSTLPRDYPKRLEALGIRCKVFAPVTPFVSTHYNYRDHRKILVIDGRVGFTGGVNLADEYINHVEKYGRWKDAAVILDGELETALRFAAERGVDVHLILPGVPDKRFAYALAKTHYKALLSSGVKISEWTPGFTHAKLVVMDGVEAVVGTINLDYRSLYHHFENAVWMRRVGSIRDMETDFQDTLARCRTVEATLQSVWQGKKLLRLMGLLLKVIAPLM